jgi:DNA-binding XRE family transcriptional regulator
MNLFACLCKIANENVVIYIQARENKKKIILLKQNCKGLCSKLYSRNGKELVIMKMLPTINMKKTGEKIYELRKEAGLSVRDLQKGLGFTTPQAIYKWQKGTALPTLDNLVVLADMLGVKIEDILIIDYQEWLPKIA